MLSGPTAVGKSRLALALAARVNGEIISADSMQVKTFSKTKNREKEDKKKTTMPTMPTKGEGGGGGGGGGGGKEEEDDDDEEGEKRARKKEKKEAEEKKKIMKRRKVCRVGRQRNRNTTLGPDAVIFISLLFCQTAFAVLSLLDVCI